MTETYKTQRPQELADIVGQPTAVKQLQGFINEDRVPHAMLFTGFSGCGKTTAARIVAAHLGATAMDIREVNAATDNGIDIVRDMAAMQHTRSLSGAPRVVIWDEAHQLTTQAQQALLKLLEDTPTGVYYILCSSEPAKIIKALHTRLTRVDFGILSKASLETILERACTSLKAIVPKSVKAKLIDGSDGSARKLLVMLDQCLVTDDMEGTIDEIVGDGEFAQDAKALVEMLYASSAKITDIMAAADAVPKDGIESLRHFILAWGASILKRNPANTFAAKVMKMFLKPFYDSGKPGFIFAIWLTRN
jgi:DNA polymerase III gamma/tau subunit